MKFLKSIATRVVALAAGRNKYQTGLDRYITANRPRNLLEVERLHKQYESNLSEYR